MDPVRTALVGYGMAGRVFHAPLIATVPGLELRTIVQRSGNEARAKYSDVTLARSLEEVLEDERIELVVVATPTPSHFKLAREALLAGKHVVVDKPFTVSSREADELIALAKERELVLTVFQNRRWDGDFLTVEHLLTDDSRFGRLVEMEARFDRFRNQPKTGAWRESSAPGSGILYDLGSHLIDQALVLFGLPEAVTAHVCRQRDFGKADDAFEIWLHYERCKVSLSAGMLVRERAPHFVLRGTEATFVKFGLDPQEDALASGRLPGDDGWGRESPDQWGVLISDRGEERIETSAGTYSAFYENVRDVIRNGAQLLVDAAQARTTIEVIEAALESSRNATSVRMTLRDPKPSWGLSIP